MVVYCEGIPAHSSFLLPCRQSHHVQTKQNYLCRASHEVHVGTRLEVRVHPPPGGWKLILLLDSCEPFNSSSQVTGQTHCLNVAPCGGMCKNY